MLIRYVRKPNSLQTYFAMNLRMYPCLNIFSHNAELDSKEISPIRIISYKYVTKYFKLFHIIISLFQDHIQEVLDKWESIDDEIWAKVIVLERNRRVAKAYARAPVLTINGNNDGFDGFRQVYHIKYNQERCNFK